LKQKDENVFLFWKKNIYIFIGDISSSFFSNKDVLTFSKIQKKRKNKNE